MAFSFSVWCHYIVAGTIQVYGYAALLGVGGSLSLVTCLGMLSHLIGENIVNTTTIPSFFVVLLVFYSSPYIDRYCCRRNLYYYVFLTMNLVNTRIPTNFDLLITIFVILFCSACLQLHRINLIFVI